MGNACPFAADKEEQQQLCRAERLASEARWLQVCWVDANAKLFIKFSRKRMFRSFTILHLSAGKLPQSCHVLANRSLLDKNFASMIDQCHRNDQNCPALQRLTPISNFLTSVPLTHSPRPGNRRPGTNHGKNPVRNLARQ